MHLFISAGEPSGDLHGANLDSRAPAPRSRHPTSSASAARKMAAAGAELLYPLTDLAVMWLGRVLATSADLLPARRPGRRHTSRRERPDAVVLIDYPGFHWHIAKRAKAAGIPVYYFVPPQLWAWAGWRVKKMRASVDTRADRAALRGRLVPRPRREHALRRPSVLRRTRGPDNSTPTFLAEERAKPGPIVALLPGSRNQEVAANFADDARRRPRQIHAARPDTRFLVAAFNESQAAIGPRGAAADESLPIEVHVGRTPEIIELADACIAVSGSVSLETDVSREAGGDRVQDQPASCGGWPLVRRAAVHHAREPAREGGTVPRVRHAGRRVRPHRVERARLAERPGALRAASVAKLEALKARVAVPGACDRAAEFLFGAVSEMRGRRAA